MIDNKFTIKCDACGSKADVVVHADGFDDAPKSFTVTRTCSGGCPKGYAPLTSQEMHEKFGLPLSGWSSARY